MRERCAYVLAYRATRRKAAEGVADSALAFLTGQDGLKEDDTVDWRAHTFRLLMALGRNDALVKALRGWITPTEADNRWRLALGYLLAERGKLPEAVSEFEAIARADELFPGEYAVMANWYLILDQKQKRDHARDRYFGVLQDHKIAQYVWQEYYAVANTQSGSAPKELNPEAIRALRVLLSKASYPANYTNVAYSLYRNTKDFRVLECLPHGAVGHTAQSVYPFLQNLTSIIRQVHEEATCDALTSQIRALQSTAKSDLDRRALNLMLAIVERRASEVLNAPGPHARAGTDALKIAFKGTWLPGEPRLMAMWLHSLGKIPTPSLRKSRWRNFARCRNSRLRTPSRSFGSRTTSR